MSISAATRVSLCVVEVYPLVSNAALGKRTTASGPSSDAAQSQVVNGRIDNQQCAQVMSGTNLAAWITIDLGYEAAVETVVVVNGLSKFTNDLYIRWGWRPGNAAPQEAGAAGGLLLHGAGMAGRSAGSARGWALGRNISVLLTCPCTLLPVLTLQAGQQPGHQRR